jgi:hypothetical protein
MEKVEGVERAQQIVWRLEQECIQLRERAERAEKARDYWRIQSSFLKDTMGPFVENADRLVDLIHEIQGGLDPFSERIDGALAYYLASKRALAPNGES